MNRAKLDSSESSSWKGNMSETSSVQKDGYIYRYIDLSLSQHSSFSSFFNFFQLQDDPTKRSVTGRLNSTEMFF